MYLNVFFYYLCLNFFPNYILIEFELIFYNASARCHINKIFNLAEGVRFLNNRKIEVMKAVNEMAVAMKYMAGGTRQKSKTIDEILQPYLSYSMMS